MQETTFNTPYQENGDINFDNIHSWLNAFYFEKAGKNFNFNDFKNLNSILKIQANLKYTFINQEYLFNSLTHSTFCYENAITSNERLEFIGDSLINLIVAKILYIKFPESPEGELSKLRGALVNEKSLASLAKTISLGENLFLGKGEFLNGGKEKESLLADAFEAIIAAIFLDSDESLSIVENSFLEVVRLYEYKSNKSYFSMTNLEQFDSKTELQEIVVGLYKIFPKYKSTEDSAGFKVELWVGEKKLAQAIGRSKKKLEKELARIVLDEKKYLF